MNFLVYSRWGSSLKFEERLSLLEDERAILQTLYAYGHGLDYGFEEEFADCWTETARLTYSFDAWNHQTGADWAAWHYEGRPAILEFFRIHTHAPYAYHKHLLAEPRIQLEGDRATVASYFVRLDESPDGPYASCFGRYLDVLSRCTDRRWRFEKWHGEIENREKRPPLRISPTAPR